MSNLKGRIDKLDAALNGQVGRCEACRGWPDPRITLSVDGGPERPLRSHEHAAERCSSCGWMPDHIGIELVHVEMNP